MQTRADARLPSPPTSYQAERDVAGEQFDRVAGCCRAGCASLRRSGSWDVCAVTVQRAEDGAAKAELLDEAACLSRLDLDEVANAMPALERDQCARDHVGQKPLRAKPDQNQDKRRVAE